MQELRAIDPVAVIAAELKVQGYQVNNAVKLMFTEGCTIPFVARYRKEVTGSLDEVALRDIRDRYNYLTELQDSKVRYFKVIEEQAQKNDPLKAKLPELRKKFEACATKQELEDLYLPFKPKRRTRAQIAREKGLEPLLEILLQKRAALTDPAQLVAEALQFVSPKDSVREDSLKVPDAAAALAGASDILAERWNETAEIRAVVRDISLKTGVLVSKKIEDAPAAEAAKYQNYFDYREPVQTAVSHRVMAVRRGEGEKILRVSIDVDEGAIRQAIEKMVISAEPTSQPARAWLSTVVEDTWKRLLSPSIETELRLMLKARAEEDAIKVFSKNLENLLLLPPIPNKTVMGVDPGLRTGSKLAVVSATGKYLESATIYPDPGREESPKSVEAKKVLLALIKKHNVECLAIGNGTGSREIDKLIISVLKENNLKDVKRVVVNEAGASVYSADDIAREEFPDLDTTIRSSISIARRLQDPLAELVKIDPRSIGVGQYQHDVNVTKLKSSLEEVVESCVNKVGVNLNTASFKLLAYVSGIGPNLAKTIVAHRDKSGIFKSRGDLMAVGGFGPKAFEQAAGFLRVPDSANPLDNSAVHPERYAVVESVARSLDKALPELIGQKAIVDSIPWDKFVTESVGMPTLRDIAAELIKPGRDPREDGSRLMYSDDVTTMDDLRPGMKLKGTVSNVTNFGAFVDIGVHQDGLVHISELSDQFVTDAAQVVAVGDVIEVRVLEVDKARKRISLSCKSERATGQSNGSATRSSGERSGGIRHDNQRQAGTGQARPAASAGPRTPAKPKAPEKSYTLDDLMSKFGRK
ncbi:RNA-binding transcriptional accessory protein [bacterium]|nr:RNA-binding transcriptional accessory protein [bacterium]